MICLTKSTKPFTERLKMKTNTVIYSALLSIEDLIADLQTGDISPNETVYYLEKIHENLSALIPDPSTTSENNNA